MILSCMGFILLHEDVVLYFSSILKFFYASIVSSIFLFSLSLSFPSYIPVMYTLNCLIFSPRLMSILTFSIFFFYPLFSEDSFYNYIHKFTNLCFCSACSVVCFITIDILFQILHFHN